MKKTLRSLVAGLVAFLMLLSFVPAAFAEDETTPQEVSAWEEDVEKNYDGSITVSEKGVEYTNGLSVHAGNEHTATVDVAKDVTLDIENGMGDVVSAYADADSQANVHVGGDVTGTISNDGLVEVTVWYEDEEEPTTENWTGYLTGVSVGFNADVTVDGSVTATGENLVSVNGVQATGWKNEEDDESTYAVSVTVGKDVTATTDQGSAYGVDAGMNIAGKMDIDVGGDVSASCKQGVTYGLSISSGADSEINAAVGGDVTVQGEGSDEWDYGVSYGVNAYTYDGGQATVSVGGNVTVSDKERNATGVGVSGKAAVSVGGDVDVTSASKLYYEEDGYINYDTANGVSATDGGTIDVAGSVTVTSEDKARAFGVRAQSWGVEEDAEASVVTVAGDVTATAKDNVAVGAVVGVYDEKETASIDIGGSVSASSEGSTAMGLNLYTDHGTVTATIGGDVTADSDTSVGVRAYAYGGGTLSATVAGDVTGKTEGLELEYYPSYDDEGATTADSTINVVIGGTLTSDGTAVLLCGEPDVEAIENGNVKLTVWQVALGEDQENIVLHETYDWEAEEESSQYDEVAEAFEKAIQYIIKVQEATGATTTLEGTQKEGDYDVALEGDTVALKVAVNNGYQLNGVYNGLGERMLLVKDANGNYSLIVPKCGGVYFSLDLALTMKLVAEAALQTADGVPVYFNFYENGFYELICGSIYDRGTYAVEDGALKLTTRRGDEVPVAADGTLTYIFRDGSEVAMTLPAETLSKLLG